jgi:GNAT superfamily N-acetyltransferase
MFKHILVPAYQTIEKFRTVGLDSVIRELFYYNREAVKVKKNLKDFNLPIALCAGPDSHYIDITSGELELNGLYFRNKSRHLKASLYLKRNYRGFGLVQGSEIVADLWYCSPMFSAEFADHKDLKWLGLTLGSKDVYGFDMFLIPEKRGHNNSVNLMGSWLLRLRDQGVESVFGYYWLDNIPALWVHRVLGWQELGRVKMSRFFSIRTSKKEPIHELPLKGV